MKNVKLTLLGLIAGLAMTACGGNEGYTECTRIRYNDVTVESYAPVRTLVAKYTSSDMNRLTSYNDEDRYFAYFCVKYDAAMEEPTLPNNFTYQQSNHIDHATFSLKYIVGIYESYGKIFLSKDKKTIKTEEVFFKYVYGSKNREIQGKAAYYLDIDKEGGIRTYMESTTDIVIKTNSEITYVEIGEVEKLVYSVKG